MLIRRRQLGVTGLSALALLAGLACSAPADDSQGLRGKGTVLFPATPTAAVPPTSVPTAAPRPTQTAAPAPTVPPAPTAFSLATAAVPNPAGAPTAAPALNAALGDDEAHVLPATALPSDQVSLPARRVIIPAIGLDSKIIPLGIHLDKSGNPAWETAPFAVGHHDGTAGPGQVGNMVLSGHISSPNEGAIFTHLGDVKPGDGIIVASDERQYLYQVTSVQVVTPQDVDVLSPSAQPTATLITCWPDHIYSHRLVVHAQLV